MKPPRIISRPNGKTPGSLLKWLVTWSITGANGRAQRRENWFPTQREAEDALRKVKAQVAAHGAKHATNTPEEQAALVRWREWTAKTPGAPSLSSVIEAAIASHTNASASMTVSEAIQLRIESAGQRKLSECHQRDLRVRLDRFAKTFGSRDIQSITTAEIEQWLHRLNLSVRSWLNYARAITSIFTTAAKVIDMPRNPMSRLERPKKEIKDPAILMPSEMRALLAAAHPSLVPLIILQSFCGVRRAEAERLTWHDLKLDGAEPYIELASSATKTNRRRTPPVPPNAAAWLMAFRGLPGSSIGLSLNAYRRRMERAADAAGIDWHPNILRHSFATYRLAVTKNAAQVAEEAGNSVTVIRTHYQNTCSPEDARAFFDIMPETPVKAGKLLALRAS